MTEATLQNECILIGSWRTFVLKYYQVLQGTSKADVSFTAVELFTKFWKKTSWFLVTPSTSFLSGLPGILVRLIVDCSLCFSEVLS